MIVDDPASHFVFVYHPDTAFQKRYYTTYRGRPMTNGEVLLYWGKWVVLGDGPWIGELARQLDPLVEARRIPCVKYDREPSRNLGVEEHVLMAYCDRRRRDEVWQLLRERGARMRAWVSERETMELWMPGGRLLERWIHWRELDREGARVAREDAAQRLGRVFTHPEAIYVPWAQ